MPNRVCKFILASVFVLMIRGAAPAQVMEIVVGVDGFTCSLCAKGVEGQFRAIDFVKEVKADLKNTAFEMKVKPDMTIRLSEIREAVTDGGFTVRDIAVMGKGRIKKVKGDAFALSAGNVPDLIMKGIDESFEENTEVEFSGKLASDNKSINLTKLRKL